MSYTINPNAKNKWARNAENTMDLSLETDASSVYLDNGRTLEQEIGEGSMVSNVATVDNAMSKVIDGTLDGAYESGVMYGKTMVNGLSNPKIQQGREYITMVSPTHLIINHGENLSEKKINVNYDWFGGKMEDGADYTLDIWILKNTMHRKTDPNATIGKFNFNNYNTGFYGIPANTLGHITYEVTTSNVNTGGKPYIETFTTCEGELEIQIVIRQGKNLVPIEQHFEGICDVKMPILRNVGKNLFDGKLEMGGYTGSSGLPYDSDIRVRSVEKIFLPKGTYTLSSDGATITIFTIYDLNGVFKKEFVSNNSSCTITLNEDCMVHICVENEKLLNSHIQLEQGSNVTSYEDHKTNILHTPETVTLRSLPNGVRDELNLKTGEYVQRIGEVVLDGSERWSHNPAATNKELGISGFNLSTEATPDRKWHGSTLCDKMPVITSLNKVGVYNGQGLNILIKSDSTNANTLKEILAKDPITVQYQLETPITTTIEPLSVPFAYENGHIVLESGFEGQSLLPTLEYSTVINRTGQIQSIANTIQKQEKQITKLEQMLIQNIIDLDYNNTLLTLKNEMEEML